MIIPISQDINKFFVNINGTNYPVKKMLFNGQGVQNVEVYADYYSQYFTIESLEDGNTVTLTRKALSTSYFTSFSYSTDNGSNWTTITNDGSSQQSASVTLNTGSKLLLKCIANQLYVNNVPTCFSINVTKNVDIYGNIMSLLYGDDFEGQYTLPSQYTFAFLCTGLVDTNTGLWKHLIHSHNLKLPATTLTNYCYYQMFYNCTHMLTAPELPATSLAQYCYGNMFYGNEVLTQAPDLPATTLANYCYYRMFINCSALVNAPVLPATTLAGYCYDGMFLNCTSLVNAPVLPATTLAQGCYHSMFYGCTSLTGAPELPALTLEKTCYQGMFSGCTSLNAIVCLAKNYASDATSSWVNNVASTGTFYKNASAGWWNIGISGIPSNWTVVDW